MTTIPARADHSRCSRKDGKRAWGSHPQKRALERYGIQYDKSIRVRIISQIRQGREARFIEASNRKRPRQIWAVKICRIVLIVVYEPKGRSGEIVTFLPKDRYKVDL